MTSSIKLHLLQANIILILLMIILSSCKIKKTIPTDVEITLEKLPTKERQKFEKIINYFRDKEDTLKLNASFFLISNIHNAKSVYYDSSNYSWNSIPDTWSINEKYFINNIDNAVEACRGNIESGCLSFKNFCNYILPYRINFETVESWREKIKVKYLDSIKSLNTYPIASSYDTTICNWFNDHLKKSFKYTSIGDNTDTKNWTELSNNLKGNCMEMTKSIIFPLRAFGVAATFDFTPCWGNINGGHAWNVLIQSCHHPNIPFMGLETNPYNCNPFLLITNKDSSKSTYRICGKVFRQAFEINKESLEYLNKGKYSIPTVFQDERILDVTNDYFKTLDVKIKVDQEKVKNETFSYLAIFNNGKWVPTAWGIIKTDGYIEFRKIAINLLYLPILFTNNTIIPISFPFVLTDKGSKLINGGQRRADITIKNTQSKELEQLSEINKMTDWNSQKFIKTMNNIVIGKKRSKPIKNKEYKLYFWNNKWKLYKKYVPKKNFIKVKGLPANSVYRLTSEGSNDYERIFTIEKGCQRWW